MLQCVNKVQTVLSCVYILMVTNYTH